jgi:hypothetical protein
MRWDDAPQTHGEAQGAPSHGWHRGVVRTLHRRRRVESAGPPAGYSAPLPQTNPSPSGAPLTATVACTCTRSRSGCAVPVVCVRVGDSAPAPPCLHPTYTSCAAAPGVLQTRFRGVCCVRQTHASGTLRWRVSTSKLVACRCRTRCAEDGEGETAHV